jgi:integrase/recombinase XerD
MRLENALEGYWLARSRNFSKTTIRNYTNIFDRFVDFIGPEREMESIDGSDVLAFLDHLKNHYGSSNRTLSTYWIGLSSLWTWAESELGVVHVIRKNVPQPKFRDPAVVPFDQEEVQRLVEASQYQAVWTTRNGKRVRPKRATALRDRAIILVLVDTGIRASELTGLTMSDYDNRRGQLFVQNGKGDKDRVVYLGQAARQALWRYMASKPDAKKKEPIFNTNTGKHMDRSSLRQILGRIGDNAGVPHVYPHRFRHTFAVNFLRNNGNALVLQRILGHSTLDTVNIYVNLAAADIEAAMGTSSPADNWNL